MALIEGGRVCIKRLGRDAGDKAVIRKVIDKNFVSIMTHARPKERRCNIKHLELLNEKIDASNKESVMDYLEVNKKPKETEKKGAK